MLWLVLARVLVFGIFGQVEGGDGSGGRLEVEGDGRNLVPVGRH